MTQSESVLNHLKTRGAITSVEAIVLYGATRLADIIWKLKKQGHDIVTEMKQGVKGRYATYSLAEIKPGV